MSTASEPTHVPTQASNDLVRSEGRLATTLSVLAGTIALLVTLIAPVSYFLLVYRAEAREATMAARLHAAFLTQALASRTAAGGSARPEDDHASDDIEISTILGMSGLDLQAMIETTLAPSELPEQRKILNQRMRVLAEAGVDTGSMSLSRSAPLLSHEGQVGQIVVQRSWAPILVNSLGVAVISGLLGLGIYALLRTLPLRSLRKALQALQREEKRALEEAEAQLQIVFQHAIDGILLIQPDGRIRSANQAAATMFGRYADQLAGQPLGKLLQLGPIGDSGFTRPGRHEVIALSDKGTPLHVDIAVSETQIGHHTQRIVILRDISHQKNHEQELARLARIDALTGLPNRTSFRERLETAMWRASRQPGQMALMFLDLDRFKTINDSLGHEVGDQLLVQVARLLEDCLRGHATRNVAATLKTTPQAVFRLGGDEFTILLEDITDPDRVARIAQAILDAFARPFVIADEEIFVSTSIGITLYPQDANDLDGLIRQADMAMYRSKALGRDTYFFFNQDLCDEVQERHAMEASLRHALERREFYLLYQPKMDLRTGRITGVEALLRWHPAGLIAPGPDRFIPILEETGLIVPIGTWVIREACQQMMHWRRAGIGHLRIAVNVSARQFRQLDFVPIVAAILAETGLEPQLLEIELTESMLIDDLEQVVEIISKLTAMGVQLAIDDFGTGHSSLSYLKRFNLDTLKIDRSFVRDTPHDPEDCAIATAVIALAHSLKLRVVAEGVENAEQLAFLQSQGCDEIQGYYLSKPQDPAWLQQWLLAHRSTPRQAADDRIALAH